jgi:glycosyltransferase involved in cell wall biosynthesis
VVVVNEGAAYPLDCGRAIRITNLLIRLARRHKVTFACRVEDQAQDRIQREFLGDHGIDAVTVHDPPLAKRGLGFYLRLLGNLPCRLPFAVASHDSRALRARLRQLAGERRVDLWQFEWLAYADALPAHARRLVMAHNVESVIWRRHRDVAADPITRRYLHHQWRKFHLFESRILRSASRVVAVSETDASSIRSEFGARHVDVVDNGVDADHFARARGQRDPLKILFLGSLDWRPNIDACRLLLDSILPRVRASIPAARLCIVGRHPDSELRRRAAAVAGVELHADVADVRGYLATSALAVVPLRIGSGSRLKILEALACGLPVVSTTVGAEGLNLAPEQHLHIADDVDGFAGAILRCLRAPEEAAEMGLRGLAFVRAHYDWDTLADRLDGIWRDTLGVPRHEPLALAEARP